MMHVIPHVVIQALLRPLTNVFCGLRRMTMSLPPTVGSWNQRKSVTWPEVSVAATLLHFHST